MDFVVLGSSNMKPQTILERLLILGAVLQPVQACLCLLDSCQQFSAHSSGNLEVDCMSCSIKYFKITSTKAEEEQQVQGALPVKIEVTH